MLGTYSKKITGQVIHVDGAASIVGGDLLLFERLTGHPGETQIIFTDHPPKLK